MPNLEALMEFVKVAGPTGLALLVALVAIGALVVLVKHFQKTTAATLTDLAHAVRDGDQETARELREIGRVVAASDQRRSDEVIRVLEAIHRR